MKLCSARSPTRTCENNHLFCNLSGTENYTYSRKWPVTPLSRTGVDEWRTGYADVTAGEYRLQFRAGDLMRTAVDDVELIHGRCDQVRKSRALYGQCGTFKYVFINTTNGNVEHYIHIT